MLHCHELISFDLLLKRLAMNMYTTFIRAHCIKTFLTDITVIE